jgi:hypothetical protein
MRLNKVTEKSRAVLRALAKGRSYEKVLASDPKLTAHDVFRALSESPTRFWRKKAVPQKQQQTSRKVAQNHKSYAQ